jgi:sarcosine oxidase subunit beta
LTPLPPHTDILIIGAGIAGLCTALYLARAGRTVTVIDRGEPWGDASGANAGTLSVQIKRNEVLHITRRAVELWQGFKAEFGIDVGFGQPGGLRVATNDREIAMLRLSQTEQRELGIETEWFDGNRLRDLAPWLGPNVRAATLCALDAYSSPLQAGHAIIQGARKAGVAIIGGAAATAIAEIPAGYRVTTSAGVIEAGTLVIAAGAWSGEVGRMLGVDLPVSADVNMLSVTEPTAPLLDRVVTHIGGILSLKQYPNGTCLIGGGWQGRGGLESGRKEIGYDNILHNLRVAAGVVPDLAKLRLVRSWAGFEGVAADALPLFGKLPGRTGVYVNACARGGYSQGPALGLLMAELITSGSTSLPMERFDPKRFAA